MTIDACDMLEKMRYIHEIVSIVSILAMVKTMNMIDSSAVDSR